jgi:hypothetical protein
MLEDLKAGKLTGGAVDAAPESTPRLLTGKGVRAVSFAQWKDLDKLELAKGASSGKIREKFTRVADMIDALSVKA